MPTYDQEPVVKRSELESVLASIVAERAADYGVLPLDVFDRVGEVK